jgi:hypothetical protein
VLKSNDPKTLAEIDAVFVTVEPDAHTVTSPGVSKFYSPTFALTQTIRKDIQGTVTLHAFLRKLRGFWYRNSLPRLFRYSVSYDVNALKTI